MPTEYKPGILHTADGLHLKVWYTDAGEWVEVDPELSEQAAWRYERTKSSHSKPPLKSNLPDH